MNRNCLRAGLLALLLVLSCIFFAACDKTDAKDPDTTPETAAPTDTTAVTEPETTLADLPASELLDKIWTADDSDKTETTDNMKLDFDFSFGMDFDVDGVQNSTTMPIRLELILDGDNTAIKGDLMGTPFDMIYVDGMLYLTADGENCKCALTPEEFASLMGDMLGDMSGADTDSGLVPDVELPDELKPSDVFAAITSTFDESTGAVTITAKGFNAKMANTFAPILRPMLESLGIVDNLDENGELITDPATVLTEIVGILHDLNEDTLVMTFTLDREGTLESVGIKLAIDSEQTMEGMTMKSTITLEGSFSLNMGGQTVKAPAGDYPEEDWRVIFGQETADMLGLVPDDQSNITLSDDPDVRTRQLDYIANHPEEFLKNITFTVNGFFVPGETLGDGTIEAIIFPPAGISEEYEACILFGELRSGQDIVWNDPMAPATVRGYFDIIEESGYLYNYFVVRSVSLAA